MNQVGGAGLRPAMGMGRGRGRGRGGAPVNPVDILGQDQHIDKEIALLPGPQNKSALSSSSSSSSSEACSVASDGSTWESIDNLPKENYERIFGDPAALPSSVGSEKKDSEEEEEEDDKQMEEIKKAYLPPGFLDPQKITLPTLSDTIDPGDERYCAVYTMANTDTVYLIFSHYFSHAVDSYIRGMGRWYFNKVQEVKLLDLNVRDEQLVVGAIVVVYHKALREWKRARIVESFHGARGRMYKVLFLDLGDFADVYSLDIVYMHESCKDKPVYAIKARLLLSPFYNSKVYSCNYHWNKAVSERILDAVQNKMVLVKFIEKVDFQNEKTWNVSLLSMKDRPGCEEIRGGRGVPEPFSGDQPIEKEVIAKLMGHRYVD